MKAKVSSSVSKDRIELAIVVLIIITFEIVLLRKIMAIGVEFFVAAAREFAQVFSHI